MNCPQVVLEVACSAGPFGLKVSCCLKNFTVTHNEYSINSQTKLLKEF